MLVGCVLCWLIEACSLHFSVTCTLSCRRCISLPCTHPPCSTPANSRPPHTPLCLLLVFGSNTTPTHHTHKLQCHCQPASGWCAVCVALLPSRLAVRPMGGWTAVTALSVWLQTAGGRGAAAVGGGTPTTGRWRRRRGAPGGVYVFLRVLMGLAVCWRFEGLTASISSLALCCSTSN